MKKEEIKMIQKLCWIIAAIFAVIAILTLSLLWIDQNLIDHRTTALVFSEDGAEYMGEKIKIPEWVEIPTECRLWPANEPLDMSGNYYEFVPKLGQWVRCETVK